MKISKLYPTLKDKFGLDLMDAKDKKGLKTKYITIIQTKAIQRYLPFAENPHQDWALDLGCGYGRLSNLLNMKCYKFLGIDPSEKLLQIAVKNISNQEFINGALPHIPVKNKALHLITLINVLRSLNIMNKLFYIKGIGHFIKKNGFLVVVDHFRKNHHSCLDENTIVDLLKKEGLELQERIPIRSGRWWMVYLIGFGLIPEKYFEGLAEYELKIMRNKKRVPQWQYHELFLLFKKVKNI